VTAGGTGQVAGKEVDAARGEHDSTACRRHGIQGLLKSARVVGFAITFGAELANGNLVRHGGECEPGGSQERGEKEFNEAEQGRKSA